MRKVLNKRRRKVKKLGKEYEFWKRCDYFEEVPVYCSTLGRVSVNGQIKKPTTNGNGKGYHLVSAEGVQHYVHQLIAHTFYGPKPEGLLIRHLNGNCKDNSKKNLKYGTYKENTADAYKHGTHVNITRKKKNENKKEEE